jgi:hypothetical protein
MTYTIDDIKRLIPDVETNTKWGELRTMLLSTRARLEVAVEALEAVNKIDDDGNKKWENSTVNDPQYWMDEWCEDMLASSKIAREALAEIKEIK